MDEDTFELAKRRLVDEVGASVRARLFRTYTLVGSAVIAAFAYANWDFVEDVKQDARSAVTRIEDEVKKAADKAVSDAERLVDAEMKQLRSTLYKQTGRLDFEVDRSGKLLSEVSNQLSKLDVEAATLTSLNETVGALSEARRELGADLAEVKGQTAQVSFNTTQIKRLAEAIEGAVPKSANMAKSVVDAVVNAQRKVDKLARRPTVYLQFAGGPRSSAKQLSELLAAEGFVMPGEERTAAAAGKREVRYFYEDDRETAEKLAVATDKALSQMNIRTTQSMKVVDFTSVSKLPKPGTLELWTQL